MSHNTFAPPDDAGSHQRVIRCIKNLHSGLGAYDRSMSELRSIDRDDVVEELRRLLVNAAPEMRSNAAEALAQIDSNLAVPLILPLLEDADSDVRWNTCGLLHDFGDSRATSALVNALKCDSQPDVRFLAACALGRVGDRSAIPAINRVIENDDGKDREGRSVRTAAAVALEGIRCRLQVK